MRGSSEIAVPREQFPEIAGTLAGFELFIPDGDLTDPGLRPGAHAEGTRRSLQYGWVRETVTGLWWLECPPRALSAG